MNNEVHFLSKKEREKISTMSNLIRYNNSIHVHNENIAEHSFYVSLYARQLSELYRLSVEDKCICIELALIHDIHETELSDIPHPVKQRLPELNDFCLLIEKEYNQKYFSELYERLENSGNKELILNLVLIADIISVLQYSDQEISFGNVRRFLSVRQNSNERLHDCIRKISSYEETNELKKILNL